jgi:hypothetical protein
MIAMDATTGRTIVGANTVGAAMTRASSPRAKNPTAMWAVGEILRMTGASTG